MESSLQSRRDVDNAPIRRKLPDWDGIFEDCVEIDTDVSVSGRLPQGLHGTLLRNGPGKRSLSSMYLDGAGMLRALTIEPSGRVRYRSRYVRTEKYLAEQYSRTPKLRGAGTQLPGGVLGNAFRLPASEANTHVLWHQNQLLALYEGGAPYRIDRETLETRSLERFQGGLPPHVAFSAHPHRDHTNDEIINFGTEVGLQGPHIRVFRLPASGGFQTFARIPLRHMSFIHDFALSPRYATFLIAPLVAHLGRSFMGLESFFECVRFQPELGTQVWIVPRDGSAPFSFEIEAFVPAHVLSAYEVGDELWIDIVEAKTWDGIAPELPTFRTATFECMRDQYTYRHRIDLKTRRSTREVLNATPCDFPRTDPRTSGGRSRFAYLAANPAPGVGGLYRCLLGLDVEQNTQTLFDHGPGHMAQEPIFVPAHAHAAENEGYVFQPVYVSKTQTSDVCVFDAAHLDAGPLCTLHIPVNAGLSFHGEWLAS